MNKYLSIISHRTLISLIIAISTLLLVYNYNLVFNIDLTLLNVAIIFPIFYTPAIIFEIGIDSFIWITGFVVLFSEFILISLYNIQDQLEYPFDKIGLDDIKLELFKFDR